MGESSEHQFPEPKTFSFDQQEILTHIRNLYCPNGFDVDSTYGNGKFWPTPDSRPRLCFDLDPDMPDCIAASSTALPLTDNSVNSIVFDPPFLTYVRNSRNKNGNMVMAKRFSGYWRYSELECHYRASLAEFARVLRPKGIVAMKCQDIVHNHRLHATHINVVQWASPLFRLRDLFVLGAKHRMPRPNRKGPPQHARIYHSYFLVLERQSQKVVP